MTVTATLTQSTTSGPVFSEAKLEELRDHAERMTRDEAPIYAGPDPRRRGHAGTLKRSIHARIIWDDFDTVRIEVYSDILDPRVLGWVTKGVGPAVMQPIGRKVLLFYSYGAPGFGFGDRVFARFARRTRRTRANDFITRAKGRVETSVRLTAPWNPERLVSSIFARLADV